MDSLTVKYTKTYWCKKDECLKTIDVDPLDKKHKEERDRAIKSAAECTAREIDLRVRIKNLREKYKPAFQFIRDSKDEKSKAFVINNHLIYKELGIK